MSKLVIYGLEELENLTVEWSTKNGIITNGKAVTQVAKLDSEFGELCKHLHSLDAGGNTELCQDDIGDMAVVLTNLSRLIGANSLAECLPDFNDKRDGILVLGDFKGQLSDNIIKEEFEQAKINIGNCFYQLIFLATSLKVDFNTCWSKAYHDIKDRVGFLTPDGNFIKSTDAAYKDWVKSEEPTITQCYLERLPAGLYEYRLQLVFTDETQEDIKFTSKGNNFDKDILLELDEKTAKDTIVDYWQGNIHD